MIQMPRRIKHGALGLAALLLCGVAPGAQAEILGSEGASFTFTATADHITTPDGGSILIWGYREEGGAVGRAQYPGPTLILTEGVPVTITLTNDLSDGHGTPSTENTSIIFPGMGTVTATGGVPGALTAEAPPGGSVTYTFTPAGPGTFPYQSGTHMDLQVEMGLFGAIVVRPLGYNEDPTLVTNPDGSTSTFDRCLGAAANCTAYGTPDTAYDREYLFLLSEIDPEIHHLVEFGLDAQVDTTAYWPVYWFINGRAAPDTLNAAFAGYLPTQPYNIIPRTRPGEDVLMRVVTHSRDLHPYHHHGNHARIVARDGRLLQRPGGTGADLATEVYTIQAVPGETLDAIFTWTGKGMGWDIYAHNWDPTDPNAPATDPNPCIDELDNKTGTPLAGGDGYEDTTWEWCASHNKPLPVLLPGLQDLALGAFYSGSPYLGAAGGLPPGEGGLNPNAGYAFMWHSHTEKELTNNDIFPGGMLTILFVEPPGTPDLP